VHPSSAQKTGWQEREFKWSDWILMLISGSGLKDPHSSLSVKDSIFPLADPSLRELGRILLKRNG